MKSFVAAVLICSLSEWPCWCETVERSGQGGEERLLNHDLMMADSVDDAKIEGLQLTFQAELFNSLSNFLRGN